jgi:hypothetical protein
MPADAVYRSDGDSVEKRGASFMLSNFLDTIQYIEYLPPLSICISLIIIYLIDSDPGTYLAIQKHREMTTALSKTIHMKEEVIERRNESASRMGLRAEAGPLLGVKEDNLTEN